MLENNLSELKIKLEDLVDMKNKVFAKEREIINLMMELEKKVFNGMTYSEYINTLDIEEIKEGVKIRVDRYRIFGTYELDGLKLIGTCGVYEDSYCSVEAVYPKKVLRVVPKIYKEEEELLKKICESYRVINPYNKIKEDYRINYY